MRKLKLTNILKEFYKSEHTIRSIVQGKRKPSYSNMYKMNKSYRIPFTAWYDIKSYLQENDTKQTSKQSSNSK